MNYPIKPNQSKFNWHNMKNTIRVQIKFIKKLLLQNSAVLIFAVKINSRKILDYFEQQFTQIPLFKSENIEMEVPEFTSLQGMWALMKDQQFQLPKWNVFKQDFNPIMRININIENYQIKFKEDEMNIKTVFSKIYRSIQIKSVFRFQRSTLLMLKGYSTKF
ncbi:hypothetical protein pb186bvf_018854 [Paramecium bursaria]